MIGKTTNRCFVEDKMKKKLLIEIIWWIYLVLLFGIVIIKFRGSFSELFAKIESTPFGTNYNLIPFRSIGTGQDLIFWGI